MRSPVESHLLCLMLETASVVSQYCDYLRKDGKAAPENYYNKMVMVLFNRNQQEIYDYAMWDQTQEGPRQMCCQMDGKVLEVWIYFYIMAQNQSVLLKALRLVG